MFRNYVAASLRSLSRDKLYASITIIGLAVGFSAAILIALFVRDELSYDQWLPLHERTYLLGATVAVSGRATESVDFSPSFFAAPMKLDYPEIEAIGRLTPGGASIRKGEIENNEGNFYWADPNIFDLLRFPAIAGDLPTALARPDGIVLTRKMAQKYFGRDDPIGETIEINRQHSMMVTAVLEDLPSNTHLTIDFVASGRAAFSTLTEMDAQPAQGFLITCLTYLRLAAGASTSELVRAMPDFIARHKFPIDSPGFHPEMLLRPLAAIHTDPGTFAVTKPRAQIGTISAVAAVGVLIIFIASVNFVNLMTARGVRRAAEVGIRKVAGASRRDLIVQFVGETVIYIAVGMALALVLAELLLPTLNAFLDRTIVFDWWGNSAYMALTLGLLLFIGILAGLYPAVVLSAFHPATVIKSGANPTGGSSAVRRSLVILQFAMLIGLILATGVIYQQTQFALNEGMRLDRDQVYLIRSNCRDAFKDEVAALPGVRATACSSGLALNYGESVGPVKLPDGTSMVVARHPVDFGFFEFYGLRPVVGRFFSQDRVGDAVPVDPENAMSAPVVLNETAARKLNFATPGVAIGAAIRVEEYRKDTMPSEIIGVVPDFSVDAIHKEVPPIVYVLDQSQTAFLNVKLSGRDIPETLESIDRLWDKTGARGPISRIFLDQRVQNLYRDVTQQGILFAAFAGVALFIACIGLFGLSAHTAARRTKEIGVRKAMGANRGDILRLLTWEFATPVLWANIVAWPVAYFAMDRWLSGFAYHIDLELWMFLAAGSLALLIALGTVAGHSVLVARAKPVAALRYE